MKFLSPLLKDLLHCKRVITLLFLLPVFSNLFSQTFPPANSCTSKDLSLVSATMPYTTCETCTPGSTVTKPLTLAINNKTGSTRTSFAFWGTLTILNANGTVFSTTSISGCFGPIPRNATTSFLYGNIPYACGKSLQITNLYLAWTDASPGATCPVLLANTSTINPKCGTLPLINIVNGVDANFEIADASCTAAGSIKVKPFGGRAPYSVQLGSGTPRIVNAGDSTTFTGLTSGTYTFTLNDANNCPVPVTRSRIIGSTGSVSPPEATVTQPTCTVATATVNLSSPSAGVTYTLTQGGITKYTAASGTFSSVIPGVYGLKASNGTCTSTGNDITVNSQPATPVAPTVTVVNNCDGSSDLTASNYTGSLLWSNSSTSASIHVTNAATYTVTQTNAAGCTS